MPLCTHYGTGNTLIIALGGYRQDMRVFEPIIAQTGTDVQWLLVHLPYISPESDVVKVYPPHELLQHILAHAEQYTYQKLYLLGFSIGGRIAQHLFLIAPNKFDKLILLNSDGLKRHFLQWVAEKKWLSEKFLTWSINRKVWPILIQYLQKIRCISPQKALFYLKHIQNTQRRKILVQIWKKYASYTTSLNKLAKHKHKILLIWSKYDEVLPVKIAKKTVKRYNFNLEIVESHHNIVEHQSEWIANKIKSM